ncbi:proteasome regulatory particle subunit [Basidiobolus ranarum]|uniref:Proteasome regulatory particle subunit n=1 Tax=Basidiobolus ranarum TaxID=34480 RepID=A0ABR2WLV7_9FUNG
MSEGPIAKIPNLDLAHYRFIIHNGSEDLREDAKQKLFEGIKENNMAPFYRLMCEELKVSIDDSLLESMEKVNEEEIQKLDEKLQDAEQNAGETEVSDVLLAKAELYAKIGDKEKALKAYKVAYEKNATVGYRLDIIFAFIRIGLFYSDNDLISRNIEKAKGIIEEGGDWDRRNRLKVYNATYLMSIRDFKGASGLYLDTLSTFTSTELMEYKEFVKYAVLTSAISLSRVDMKKKVLEAPEVLEVLHEIPGLEDYITSLYNGNYAKFFQSLALMEEKYLKASRLLFPHMRFYVREMRIIAYAQLLESYRSLTIESMATAFGVSEEFIDNDLSKFISAGRLNCVIDKVNGIVETNRPDNKNAQYQQSIKQGDLLLNRIQKLSRVINV